MARSVQFTSRLWMKALPIQTYWIVQVPVCTNPVSRLSTSRVRWNMFLAPTIGDLKVIGTVITRLPFVFDTVAPAVFTEHAELARLSHC